MTETILVFPAGLPDAQRFRVQAEARGAQVIGASSLAFDPAAGDYGSWETLPYVHHADFGDALSRLLRRRGVESIYTPHEVVSGVIADIIDSIAPGVRLISPNPVMAQEKAYGVLLDGQRAAAAGPQLGLSGGRPALSAIERAGLIRLVDSIPGMTDLDKIAAVIDTMRYAPRGDLVEIGSWWGRSAALLALLARRWDLGHVLCIDPWRVDCVDQGVEVLDRASRRMDMDQALRIFEINVGPLARGSLNYIRATAAEAAGRYRPGLTLESEVFGRTAYTGSIAYLHIDGNHAYDQVASDSALWTPHVAPGGWIVFDDYVWAFGDGPRRVGDAFLEAEADRIDLSFVIGTALFVRLGDR